VKGRNGQHGVRPEQYESFRSELKHRLLTDCKDPASGEQIVTHVWTGEEAFHGPHCNLAPDLTLELRDHGFFSVRREENCILRRRPRPVGTHHPQGVFVARGAGVRRSAHIDPVRLLDIAPTVLHRLGLPIPEDLEGRVIEEIFTPAWTETHRARKRGTTRQFAYAAATTAALAGEDGDSAEQHADLVEKLKLLGYME
jgi:predicted AlkP superfamily phosphohydrolase/phosphomutase